ncbi:MAG: hypothetical protein ABJO36_06145 [Litorimonas sp.]
MYFKEIVPFRDDDDFWTHVDQAFKIMEADFRTSPIETKNQALRDIYSSGIKKGSQHLGAIGVIKYRVSDDRDSLEYYHLSGIELIPVITAHIAKRELSAAFLADWGQFCYCFGFVMNSAFAHGNDLQNERAGRKGGDAVFVDDHRVWFSKMYLRELQDPKYKLRRKPVAKRPVIEANITRLIEDIVRDKDRSSRVYPGLSIEWFKGFLKEDGSLKTTYLQKSLTEKSIRNDYSKRNVDCLPPLDLKIPIP